MSSLTGKDLEEFNARKKEIEILKGFFPEIKDDDEKLLGVLRTADIYRAMPKATSKDSTLSPARGLSGPIIIFDEFNPEEIPYEKEEELQEELEKAREEIKEGKIEPVDGPTIVGVSGVKEMEDSLDDNTEV